MEETKKEQREEKAAVRCPKKTRVLWLYHFWEEPDQRPPSGVTAHMLTMNPPFPPEFKNTC